MMTQTRTPIYRAPGGYGGAAEQDELDNGGEFAADGGQASRGYASDKSLSFDSVKNGLYELFCRSADADPESVRDDDDHSHDAAAHRMHMLSMGGSGIGDAAGNSEPAVAAGQRTADASSFVHSQSAVAEAAGGGLTAPSPDWCFRIVSSRSRGVSDGGGDDDGDDNDVSQGLAEGPNLSPEPFP